jgi:cytochrome c oxidase subunit 3
MPTATEPARPMLGGPPPFEPVTPTGGGGDDGGGRPEKKGHSSVTSVVGVVVLMCASIMTFGAMTFAMIARRALSDDWHSLPLPHILWWNTGVLILSSVAIDLGRRQLRRNRRPAFNLLWSAGTVMGTWFLIGQIIAWTQLESKGFFLMKGNPVSAFFYVLTWAHAAHVVGALAAVYYVEYRGLRYELGPNRRSWVDASALFWHFLDVLWLGIMGLFTFWA